MAEFVIVGLIVVVALYVFFRVHPNKRDDDDFWDDFNGTAT